MSKTRSVVFFLFICRAQLQAQLRVNSQLSRKVFISVKLKQHLDTLSESFKVKFTSNRCQQFTLALAAQLQIDLLLARTTTVYLFSKLSSSIIENNEASTCGGVFNATIAGNASLVAVASKFRYLLTMSIGS